MRPVVPQETPPRTAVVYLFDNVDATKDTARYAAPPRASAGAPLTLSAKALILLCIYATRQRGQDSRDEWHSCCSKYDRFPPKQIGRGKGRNEREGETPSALPRRVRKRCFMQSRIIGRYRESDGRIVRCDVEAESKGSKATQRDARGERPAPDKRAGDSSEDRNLAGHDRQGSMLMF